MHLASAGRAEKLKMATCDALSETRPGRHMHIKRIAGGEIQAEDERQSHGIALDGTTRKVVVVPPSSASASPSIICI
jgi:hypothetical protein